MQAPRQARLECPAAPAPGYRDAMSTRGFGGLRDVGSNGYSWFVDDYGLRCPLLVLPLQWGQPAEQQCPCVRFSVALPPGIGRGRPGPGVPLGTRRLDLTRTSGTPAGTAGRRRLRVPMPATWASTTAFSPDRPAKRPVGAVFSCVASRNRERTSRPRASATADGAKQKAGRASCGASATTGSAGRRRRSAPMPTACTSTTAESTRRTLASMRTVFRCVASRNRERTSRPRTKPPSPPSRPNPLGENQSLSSPPLEPRRLLLCYAAESKQRSQPRGLRPLG